MGPKGFRGFILPPRYGTEGVAADVRLIRHMFWIVLIPLIFNIIYIMRN